MWNRQFNRVILIFTVLGVVCPQAKINAQGREAQGISGKASRKTRLLFENLRAISGRQIMFGHQDDLAYGVHWQGESSRSDVKEVCGAYPSVFGWDVGELDRETRYNIDSVPFERMRAFMQYAYKIGSVNTISWHLDNLGTGGDAWDTTAVVRELLPGGRLHWKLKAQLDIFADYVNSLKSKGFFRHKIPVIFRPWHENTGHWFWWGQGSCSPQEFIALWRFTVDYLREEKKVRHLLYAFSPSSNYSSPDEYLKTYPGDDYVDILGVDYYFHDYNIKESARELPALLSTISRIADERGKVSALTETGFETIPDSVWWTKTLLGHIESNLESSRIAYLLVWRNAWTGQRPNHFYAPYPGHHSAPDFVEFSQSPRIVLNNRMPSMYRKPNRQFSLPQGKTSSVSMNENPSKR